MEQDLQDALNEAVAQQLRADSAEKDRDAEKARADKLRGELTGMTSQFEALRKERGDVDIDKLRRTNVVLANQLAAEKKARMDAESPERMQKAVAARVALQTKAATILDGARFDEMSDREIKVAVIERLDGKVEQGASDGFVDGQFDVLVRGHQNGAAAIARVREITEQRQDKAAKSNDGRTARQKFLEKQSQVAFAKENV